MGCQKLAGTKCTALEFEKILGLIFDRFGAYFGDFVRFRGSFFIRVEVLRCRAWDAKLARTKCTALEFEKVRGLILN